MHLRSSCLIARCAVIVLLALSALAQQPTIPSTGFPGLDQYRASRIAIFTDDFGQLAHYRDANAALKPPAPTENRVVFFGDSITEMWKFEDYFVGKPYLNRGVGGQTTPQMLVRFRQDAIELHPRVVIILAGTNDIAGNTGPMRLEDIEGQLHIPGGTGAGESPEGGLCFGLACAQLHSAIAGFFRAASARENPGAQPLAPGLLLRQRAGVSRLLLRHGG